MEVVTPGPDASWRHPTRLELFAGILLAATVILHVVGMIPAYFAGAAGHASLFSQADQAASYSVLAAGWAVVLGIGLAGPSRIPICAGLATGLAVTEFGFRFSDVGAIIRYGSDLAGAGLWIMVAAWVVGAAAAVVLVVAARLRGRRTAGGHSGATTGEQVPGVLHTAVATGSPLWIASHAGGGVGNEVEAPSAAGPDVFGPESFAPESFAPESAGPESFAPESAGPEAAGPEAAGPEAAGPEALVPEAAGPEAVAPQEEPVAGRSEPVLTSILWTVILGFLGLVTALFFLPAWDHYVGVTSTGHTFSFNLGNAFSGPWEVVLGNVFVALAIVAIPIAGSRLRDRGAAAAAVGGSLIVLGSQFVSAVVQVDQPVMLTTIPVRYLQQGSQFGIKLTGWFTIDVLAAFALFAAAMVWATSRVVYANSRGTVPKTPDVRSEAMTSAS
jgi:hypothetical protein